MAGIEDVAKLAGVSTATVSRALTGKAHVSEKTRQKVEAAAAELGYLEVPEGTIIDAKKAAAGGGRWRPG